MSINLSEIVSKSYVSMLGLKLEELWCKKMCLQNISYILLTDFMNQFSYIKSKIMNICYYFLLCIWLFLNYCLCIACKTYKIFSVKRSKVSLIMLWFHKSISATLSLSLCSQGEQKWWANFNILCFQNYMHIFQ